MRENLGFMGEMRVYTAKSSFVMHRQFLIAVKTWGLPQNWKLKGKWNFEHDSKLFFCSHVGFAVLPYIHVIAKCLNCFIFCKTDTKTRYNKLLYFNHTKKQHTSLAFNDSLKLQQLHNSIRRGTDTNT